MELKAELDKNTFAGVWIAKFSGRLPLDCYSALSL